MSCGGKYPPKLNDDGDYEIWKKDVEIWCELTSDFNKNKQALAIHLQLCGRARIASSELSIDDLKKDNGVQILIEKLDSIFLHDKGRRQFACFRDLYKLQRDASVSIDDFICKFEHMYYNFKKQGMELPDTVIAFMLLESCNLEEKDKQLILSAMTEIKFDGMKAALKRVFGGKICSVINKEIKSEPVFETSSESDALYARNRYIAGYAARGRGEHRNGRYNSRQVRTGSNSGRAACPRIDTVNKPNPKDANGNFMRCLRCNSKYHFIRFCPHKEENDEQEKEENCENVQLMLFVAYTNDKRINKLVSECCGHALLDSGCSTTVCGEAWLADYFEGLSDYDKKCLVEKSSNSTFTFGDGARVKSLKKINLPCYISDMRAEIEVDVVPCNIPLLMSKTSMKKAKMCLNFGDDSAVVCGRKIKLTSTESGHYILPLSF